MPTVIDSLVVEFGLDPKNFTAGQKQILTQVKELQQESQKGATETERQTRKAADGLSMLKREAIAMLGAFFGGRGVKDLVAYLTTFDAAVGRSAKTLNVSTQELSKWQGVAQQTGGTAESVTASLQGITDELNKFQLGFGPLSFLGPLNALGISQFDEKTGKLKTATQLLLDLNHAIQGMDPARARALLSAFPIDSNTINMLLLSEKTLKDLIAAQEKLGVVTREDAEAAGLLQSAWYGTLQAARSLARVITTYLTPAGISFLDTWKDIFNLLRAGDFKGALKMYWDGTNGKSSGGGFFDSITGYKNPAGPGSVSGGRSSETEAYIREAAAKRGIDPNVAVAVARSEGLHKYVGDQGTSFGPFQLHYKNNIPGLSNAGLGDEFTRRTGLDARDPSTVKQQIDFALDQAMKSGWGAWHGWKGLPFAGIGAGAPVGAAAAAASGNSVTNQTAGDRSTSIRIDNLNVRSNASDGEGTGRDIKNALERTSLAAHANTGAE